MALVKGVNCGFVTTAPTNEMQIRFVATKNKVTSFLFLI